MTAEGQNSTLDNIIISLSFVRRTSYRNDAQDEPAQLFFGSIRVRRNDVQYISKACNKISFMKYCTVKRDDSSGSLYVKGF